MEALARVIQQEKEIKDITIGKIVVNGIWCFLRNPTELTNEFNSVLVRVLKKNRAGRTNISPYIWGREGRR
jgi:hypothetical protein